MARFRVEICWLNDDLPNTFYDCDRVHEYERCLRLEKRNPNTSTPEYVHVVSIPFEHLEWWKEVIR